MLGILSTHLPMWSPTIIWCLKCYWNYKGRTGSSQERCKMRTKAKEQVEQHRRGSQSPAEKPEARRHNSHHARWWLLSKECELEMLHAKDCGHSGIFIRTHMERRPGACPIPRGPQKNANNVLPSWSWQACGQCCEAAGCTALFNTCIQSWVHLFESQLLCFL